MNRAKLDILGLCEIRSPEVRIVMGDINARVGKHSEPGNTGIYGLGKKTNNVKPFLSGVGHIT